MNRVDMSGLFDYTFGSGVSIVCLKEKQMNFDPTILIPAAIVLLLAWFALNAFVECEWQKDERKERRRVERLVDLNYPKVY